MSLKVSKPVILCATVWRKAFLGLVTMELLLGRGAAAQQPSADGVPATTPSFVDPASLPHDYSLLGMIENADHVVQAVMGGLALASVLSWTILIAKLVELAAARRSLRAAAREIAEVRSLDEASRHLSVRGPVRRLLESAETELRLSAGHPVAGIKERVGARLERLVAAAGRRLGVGLGPLATIGATAPFVGLFGTVWGIMNSFVAISEAQATNLSIVAPGIAEALLATAIGLGAAIPAVIMYNVLSKQIVSLRAALADVGSGILLLVGRDLERPAVTRAA